MGIENGVFTIQGASQEECLLRARELYGKNIKVVRTLDKKTNGFLGFFKKDYVELTCYLMPDPDLSKYAFGIYNKNPAQKPPEEDLFLGEKEKILAKSQQITGADPKITQILAEVKGLREKLDEMPQNAPEKPENENIKRIEALLEQNDFLPSFRKKMLDKLKKETPYDTLNDYDELEQLVLERAGDEIRIYSEEKHYKFPRIIVIVGPTGVGKTTTVAKLAARFVFGADYGLGRNFNTALITIDQFRLGAIEQLQKFADTIRIPCELARDDADLKRTIALMGESAEVIIVDTVGRSPRDGAELAYMKKMLDACGSKAEYFLAMSAATKAPDMVSILKQFEIFAYSSVIITKLDETMRAGNVISALSELGKSIAYIADGQGVPRYLQKANPIRLLINLDGFEANRDRLEKRFGVK
ncbi:MAG: flagellar biosynthesis protein FlhF [Spirochaetaceae bacterium]|jgi:flagellar biosynthesis protein FlhF|nr:flagellar biosynthesis protein FlhF [Spirochaetaceae bacterium]